MLFDPLQNTLKNTTNKAMPESGCRESKSSNWDHPDSWNDAHCGCETVFFAASSTSRSRQHQAEHCTFKSVALLVAKRLNCRFNCVNLSAAGRLPGWRRFLSAGVPPPWDILNSQPISTHIKPYHICIFCIFCIFSGFSGSVMPCPHCRQSFLFRMSTCLPILSVFCNFLQCRRR